MSVMRMVKLMGGHTAAGTVGGTVGLATAGEVTVQVPIGRLTGVMTLVLGPGVPR